MFARALSTSIVLLAAAPVWSSPANDLLDLLGVEDVIEIMQVEGAIYGAELASEMLPGGNDAGWVATVERIYDTSRMEATVRSVFAESLTDTDVTPLLQFFESEAGKRIVELEVTARSALVDDDVEDAAVEAFLQLEESGSPRFDLVQEFVETNDLIEANVVGSLNASIQFYLGLAEGGALEMSETDILRDVWSQEAETRANTREWVYSYLLMSYGPLEDAALREYIALSGTEEGRAMNRALFAAFNQMYDSISYALGLAAAGELQAQDL